MAQIKDCRPKEKAENISVKGKSNQAKPVENFCKSRDKEKYLNISIISVLLGFGIYQSIIYFGYQVTLSSDFTSFISIGKSILSFQLPENFKIAPGLGVMLVSLGRLIGGQQPYLTAGWVLSAILHPLNVIMLFLIAKKIVGKSAFWLIIITIINPWIIRSVGQPAAEITLLFFFLLSFYLILRKSSSAYLFAAIAAMVRFEGVILILIVLVFDLIRRESRKEKKRAFIYAGFAILPFALWMLAIVMHSQWPQTGNHLQEQAAYINSGNIWLVSIKTIWQAVFSPLCLVMPKASNQTFVLFTTANKITATATFLFGSIYAIRKRNWNILALLLLLLSYIAIQITQLSILPGYCMPVQWIVLFISVFGLQKFWQLINKYRRIPRFIIAPLQVVTVLMTLIWLVSAMPYLPQIAQTSPSSKSIPFVAIAIIISIFVIRRFFYELRGFLCDLTITMVALSLIISNQFLLVDIIGKG